MLYLNYIYRLINLALRLAFTLTCLKWSGTEVLSDIFFLSNLAAVIVLFGIIDVSLFRNRSLNVSHPLVLRLLIIYAIFILYSLAFAARAFVDVAVGFFSYSLFFLGTRLYDYKMLLSKTNDYLYIFIQSIGLAIALLAANKWITMIIFLLVGIYVFLRSFILDRTGNGFPRESNFIEELPYGILNINQWLISYSINLILLHFNFNNVAVDYYLHGKVLEAFAAIASVASSLKYTSFNLKILSKIENYLAYLGVFAYLIFLMYFVQARTIDYWMVFTLTFCFLLKIAHQKKFDKIIMNGRIPAIRIPIVVTFFSVFIMFLMGYFFQVYGIYTAMIMYALLNYKSLKFMER